MRKSLFIVASLFTAFNFTLASAHAAGTTTAVAIPKPPAPVPQSLPLNAKVSPNGVYVPVSKSGDFGITLQRQPQPTPDAFGGSASLTWQVK